MPSPKHAKKGKPHLKRDDQQWFFDWMVKETGKTFHFQGDGRGRFPRSGDGSIRSQGVSDFSRE